MHSRYLELRLAIHLGRIMSYLLMNEVRKIQDEMRLNADGQIA